jgi:serine/threonine protein phosphatase PrpC
VAHRDVALKWDASLDESEEEEEEKAVITVRKSASKRKSIVSRAKIAPPTEPVDASEDQGKPETSTTDDDEVESSSAPPKDEINDRLLAAALQSLQLEKKPAARQKTTTTPSIKKRPSLAPGQRLTTVIAKDVMAQQQSKKKKKAAPAPEASEPPRTSSSNRRASLKPRKANEDDGGSGVDMAALAAAMGFPKSSALSSGKSATAATSTSESKKKKQKAPASLKRVNRKARSAVEMEVEEEQAPEIPAEPVITVDASLHLDPGKGRKGKMEDRALVTTLNLENPCLAGTVTLAFVCDGHGGYTCAEFIIQHYPDIFARTFNELRREKDPADQMFHISTPANGIMRSVLALSDDFDSHSRIHRDRSGSTLTGTVIHHNSGQQWLFNLGDSRSVVLNPDNGHVLCETRDHKPDSAIEIARVEQRSRELARRTGGRESIAIEKDEHGLPRLEGMLAMTRAIGDNDGGLINKVDRVPDVFLVTSKAKRVTVLASDGIWDVMDPRGVGSERMGTYVRDQGWDDLAAKHLVEKIKADPACTDNLSAIIVRIQVNAPRGG